MCTLVSGFSQKNEEGYANHGDNSDHEDVEQGLGKPKYVVLNVVVQGNHLFFGRIRIAKVQSVNAGGCCMQREASLTNRFIPYDNVSVRIGNGEVYCVYCLSHHTEAYCNTVVGLKFQRPRNFASRGHRDAFGCCVDAARG